jgi:hypothetical protein
MDDQLPYLWGPVNTQSSSDIIKKFKMATAGTETKHQAFQGWCVVHRSPVQGAGPVVILFLPLYMTCFSCLFIKFSLFHLFWAIWIWYALMSLSSFVCVCIHFITLLGSLVYCFHQIWKLLAIISPNIFVLPPFTCFSFPLESAKECILCNLKLSHGTVVLF